jgi:hypothetical protein
VIWGSKTREKTVWLLIDNNPLTNLESVRPRIPLYSWARNVRVLLGVVGFPMVSFVKHRVFSRFLLRTSLFRTRMLYLNRLSSWDPVSWIRSYIWIQFNEFRSIRDFGKTSRNFTRRCKILLRLNSVSFRVEVL